MTLATGSKKSGWSDWLRDHYLALVLVFVAVALLAIGYGFVRFGFETGYVAVAALGAFVGVVELVGRYLYSPERAVLTVGGVTYVAVNMIAAVAAYYMIGPHGFDLFPAADAGKGATDDLAALKRILLAGFGALAFMRTSIFNVQVGDSAIGIGPAALLDALLKVADRGVDRREAIYRAREVTNALANVDPVKGAALLASYCLALMQNLSTEEQVKAKDALTKIASDEKIDKDIRLDLIALELSRIVGPDVLEVAVEVLGARLAKASANPPPSPRAASAAAADRLEAAQAGMRGADGSGATPSAASSGSGPADHGGAGGQPPVASSGDITEQLLQGQFEEIRRSE